jgi:soluble lytic murein transglycosylase-like protein
MRYKFVFLYLIGALLLSGISAKASIALNPPDASDGPAPAREEKIERPADTRPSDEPHSVALDVERSEAALPPDDNMAGESPDARAKSPLERARAALEESNAPALSNQEICTSLVAVAQENNLPVGFFANLIWRESRFDHEAISRVGAMGIAQFMPDVAEKLGLNAFDARDALLASGRLLRTLRARFGNLGLVAAAYNAGPKRVADWLRQRAGLPRETREYVSLITGKAIEQWRSIKAKTAVFSVPPQVPCHRSAEFSAVESAERNEQLQKVAEEQRSRPKKRQAIQLFRKAKPRPGAMASRSRSS